MFGIEAFDYATFLLFALPFIGLIVFILCNSIEKFKQYKKLSVILLIVLVFICAIMIVAPIFIGGAFAERVFSN